MKTEVFQTLTLAIAWLESGVVTVFLQPVTADQLKGRITIVNLGDAWSAYWDAMPEPLAQFFVDSPDDYLVSKLHQRPITRHETARLKRIIGVVRAALQEQLSEGGAPVSKSLYTMTRAEAVEYFKGRWAKTREEIRTLPLPEKFRLLADALETPELKETNFARNLAKLANQELDAALGPDTPPAPPALIEPCGTSGCQRIKGHGGFHVTHPDIARKEDLR